MTGWATQIVEADGTPVGDPLDTLPGGQVTYGLPTGAQSPHRISLVCADRLPDMRGRFLVDHWAGDPSAAMWWVLAPEAPRALSDAAATRTLSGTDLTRLLSRRGLPRPEIFPVGAFVLETVDNLLTRYMPQHKARFRVADIDTSVRAELAFGTSDTLLTATTEPLLAGAMTAWSPLPGGLVESTPWLPPAQRPDSGPGFGDDTAPDATPFLPDGWSDDPADAAPPPNEVLAIARGERDAPEIVGRWADELDIQRHGATTVLVPGPVDAVDQAAADTIARRWAEDHIKPRRAIQFTGAFSPILPGEVCPVVWQRWGINGRFELIGKTVERDVAATTTYTMKEV